MFYTCSTILRLLFLQASQILYAIRIPSDKIRAIQIMEPVSKIPTHQLVTKYFALNDLIHVYFQYQQTAVLSDSTYY